MRSLPVLLYHSVAAWSNPITVHPATFEAHLRAMRRAGWRGIGLDEAAEILDAGRPVPRKACLITFDDGYLDNYVHAWPLLAEYGHRATIFAVTAKLEAAGQLRPTLAEVRAGRSAAADLPRLDHPFADNALGLRERRDQFMNWAEARTMVASGVVAVEAHSHRHRSVFTGPEWSGFYTPGVRKRTFDRIDAPVTWGLPRFASGPALARPAFRPAEELYALVGGLVPQEPAAALAWLSDEANRAELTRRVAALGPGGLGRIESQAEFAARCREELAACCATLERELGRRPTALAWPWGPYADAARAAGRELGLRLFFCTTVGPNLPGGGGHVHRFVAKDKSPAWLRSRLFLYSHALAAGVYARLHR